MLTKTSLKNPSTLKKVKEAILDAVRSASVHPSGQTIVAVYNSKDKHFLNVLGIKGLFFFLGYGIMNSLKQDLLYLRIRR